MLSVHAKGGIYLIKTGDISINPPVQILITSPYGTENMCFCHHHGRHFLTKEEKIAKLNEYKQWLDNESKDVEETYSPKMRLNHKYPIGNDTAFFFFSFFSMESF